MEILILTGMSGAGKTQAANTLEDIGFFCIDNLPAIFIPQFADIYSKHQGSFNNVAFVIDIRGETSFDTLLEQIKVLRESGHTCRVLFIECNKDVLINRYRETRRIHPLVSSRGVTTNQAIDLEVEMLSPLREQADYVINTSKLNIHQLHDKIAAIFKSEDENKMAITCMSFGFKHGMPNEADLVFDVRCFPNPFYIPELKKLTGLDTPVSDYVFSFKQTNDFVAHLFDMIDHLLPLYIEEGRRQFNIAIGCTGGKHRSVAIAEKLNAHLKESKYNSITIHRDIIL